MADDEDDEEEEEEWLCTDQGQRGESGGRLETDIHMRKKGKNRRRTGLMVGIYRACRE